MASGELTVQQRIAEGCIVEKLPDGSTAVFDKVMNAVHALDSSAAAAFEACREPITLSALTGVMRQRLGEAVEEETALEAIAELEHAGLVVVSGPATELENSSRRELLKAAGVALPVVLTLTASEQRALAAGASSTTTTTSTTTTSTTTTTTTTTTSGSPSIVSASVSVNGNPEGTTVPCDEVQDIAVVGRNTHFGATTTVGSFSQPYDPSLTPSVLVTDATHLTVHLYVSYLATNGAAFNFTLSTGSEVVNVTGLLTVSC